MTRFSNNPLGDFGDKMFEQLEDIKDTAVREVKSIPKVIKKQVVGDDQNNQDAGDQQPKVDPAKAKKMDPVTGKPIPSKKMVTQLAQSTNQVAQMKLQKIREELDKQRLKVSEGKEKLSPIETGKAAGSGPAMPTESAESDKAPQNDAVAAMLRGSKSTGEVKGSVGG